MNSLLVAGWAGLVVNALNCIPAGELDGGRIALAVFGRRTYNVLGLATTGVLAATALASSLSFYWVGLVLFLQVPTGIGNVIMPTQKRQATPQATLVREKPMDYGMPLDRAVTAQIYPRHDALLYVSCPMT